MKKLIIILLLLSLAWTLVLVPYIGIPYTWTLSGKTVVDSTHYTGKYYQCNENVRIVIDHDIRSNGSFDRYVIYAKQNDKWIKTSAYSYTSMFNINPLMLFYMKYEYKKYKHQVKIREKRSIL